MRELPHVGEVAGDRRGGGHRRADEVRAAARALAALEVAVRGRGAALARRRGCRGSCRGTSSSPPRATRSPALVKTRSRPSASACALHLRRARHDHRAHARRRRAGPSTTAAAARRSSMRAFVHEPMKTRSIADLRDRRARLEAHVARARARPPRARPGRRSRPGRERRPSIGATMPGVRAPGDLRRERGDVDLDRRGRTSRPASVRSARHRSSAAPRRRPSARPGGPRGTRTSSSSGAIIPARAPPSIDMLQIVIRPSIESASIAGPAYSIACPTPPATPIWPIAPSTMSFAVTPNGSSPAKRTRIVFGRACGSVCVASTCSTSEVPMPNASAPNAPCVEVWQSPQTIVIPGCVSPSSGPITCTIPSRPLPVAFSGTPNSSQFARERVELRLRERVADRARLGRDVVVHRRDRQVGPAHRRARAGAAPRTPAGSSPRARGGGRCRAAPARPAARRRRASSQIFSNSVVPLSASPRRSVAAEDAHLARPLAHLGERRPAPRGPADGRRAPCRSGSGTSSAGSAARRAARGSAVAVERPERVVERARLVVGDERERRAPARRRGRRACTARCRRSA